MITSVQCFVKENVFGLPLEFSLINVTSLKGPDELPVEKKKKENLKKKISIFFYPKTPPTTLECPQQISTHLVQPFSHIYIYVDNIYIYKYDVLFII